MLKPMCKRKPVTLKKFIKNWCKAASYDKPVAYTINYSDPTVTIITVYAENPEMLMGDKSKQVIKFEHIVAEYYHTKFEVNFAEINGGFVNYHKEETK